MNSFQFCFNFAFNFNLRRYSGGRDAHRRGARHALLRHGRHAGRGRAVQVDPIEPKLKLPGTKRLKLKCDILLSTSAFKFNLRRYGEVRVWDMRTRTMISHLVGRCRLTVSKPMLKAPVVSALETGI